MRMESWINPFFAVSSIRLMNLLGLILVHRLYVEATSTKERILPLSLQMDFAPPTEAAHISGKERAFVPQINLNHGTYHSNVYLMDSISLSLQGSGTTICHTSSLTKSETVNDPDPENHGNENENSTPFIFVFSNSTISMSQISLDCGWRGTSVGRISSSRLTIDNCPIISNAESSPFVIHNERDDFGSSIFFVDCCHKSIEKSSLLALVSLTPSHTTHSCHTDTDQEVPPTLVSCSGLSLSDTHLVLGSGPLVAFSSSTEQNTGFWNNLETVLMKSRLVNMTSDEDKGALEGWRRSQKILGSSVTQSTNHLSGTTCIDMNLGGSLLCSNTSFSHCQSSLEPEMIRDTDDRNIRRCTFLSMTSSEFGAAIYHALRIRPLIVSECSFSKCSAEGGGGSIGFHQLSDGHTPITISSSLFVDCSAQAGGAVDLMGASICTMDKVVFLNNNASLYGGGLAVSTTDQLTLSNCVFEKCDTDVSWASYGGGGVYLYNITSLSLDSVLFRRCSAKEGNDIHILSQVITIQTLLPNVTNCDSTSERPNVYLSFSFDNTLIPAVPDASTASLVMIDNTPSVDQTSSTIRMRVSNNVNGKMLVLVDNPNHERPNDDSPPAIARLLTFDFSTSTKSATQEVSFGDWEKLQYESEYCVIAASITNTRLTIPPSITLTTPNPPRIVQITCSLGSGTDHCWLQLKGRTLPIGRYTVKLVAVPELTFSVEFDGSKGGPNTLNMFSSRHSERLFGAGSKLTFSTKYEVASIRFEDDTEPFFLDPPRLFFTPVEQPRLISIGPVSFKNESTKDTILIPRLLI
ncbi:hypothetical protein BLNAU_19859 [Blattamonas nauphoetae]|uniref:Uncharacterized protein n=1 Tax=Blattamonas nauphoetae TaxID=2049346 RepID=A0ABQ9X1J5_9EUKA|nr:hypothetical protein BLNAU_19859 [Blattamonas nauphoetae]